MQRDPEVGLGHSRYWFLPDHPFSRAAIMHDAGYDAVFMWKNNYNFSHKNRFIEYIRVRHGDEYLILVKLQYERLSNKFLNARLFLDAIDLEFYNDCKLISEGCIKLRIEARLFFRVIKAFRALFR